MARTKTKLLSGDSARSWSLNPRLAIVLGSGFSDAISDFEEIGSWRVRGLPKPTVEGHSGRIIVVNISGLPVIVLSGRCHFYEGFKMDQITFPVRVLAELGV